MVGRLARCAAAAVVPLGLALPAAAQTVTIGNLPLVSTLSNAALFPCEVPGQHTSACSIAQLVQAIGGLDAQGGVDEAIGLVTPNVGIFSNETVDGTLSFGPAGLLDLNTARVMQAGSPVLLGTLLANIAAQASSAAANTITLDAQSGIDLPIGLVTPKAAAFTNEQVSGTLSFGASGMIDSSARVTLAGNPGFLDAILLSLQTTVAALVTRDHGITHVQTGSSYQVLATDDVVEWSSSAQSAKTTTLDVCSASNSGEPHTIVAGTDAATYTNTIAAASGDAILGQPTFAMTSSQEAVDLVCDGAHVWIVH